MAVSIFLPNIPCIMKNDIEYPREYANAWNVLERSITTLNALPVKYISTMPVSNQTKVHLFADIFKSGKIPGGIGWMWNQTRKRYSGTLYAYNAKVEFFKLIPRKRSNSSDVKIPSFKLWQYNIKFLVSGRSMTMLWCEKGIKPQYLDDLNLDDLQFLADFMEPDVINEVWPSGICNKRIC